jgi:general secretion pathway protein B
VARSPAPVKAQPDAEDTRDMTETMGSPPPATPKTLPELETSEWERLQSMWDVPQDVRIELVKLKITVHVYNEDPRKRFVVVNRHRYGEGDSLETEGLILKRIVRDGIIIDYGEGLVKL